MTKLYNSQLHQHPEVCVCMYMHIKFTNVLFRQGILVKCIGNVLSHNEHLIWSL